MPCLFCREVPLLHVRELRKNLTGYNDVMLAGTNIMVTEDALTPFSVIGPQRRLANGLVVHKLFSQAVLTEDVLQRIFLNLTVLAQRCAAPTLLKPEQFQPFELTAGLYLNNAWENAASAMEMSCVAARNAGLLMKEHLRMLALNGAEGGLPGSGMKGELR